MADEMEISLSEPIFDCSMIVSHNTPQQPSASLYTVSMMSLWSGLSPLLFPYPSHKETNNYISSSSGGLPLHLTLNVPSKVSLNDFHGGYSEVIGLHHNNDTTYCHKEENHHNTIILISDDEGDHRHFITTKKKRLKKSNASPSLPSSQITCCGIKLSPVDLDCLRPSNWLNDQVINCYMKLVMKYKKDVYITNTFFYSKLNKNGFEGVVNWLKKVNISGISKLLVPINLPCHWSLGFIDLENKKIKYYDSLGLYNRTCLKKLQDFVTAMSEHFKLNLETTHSLWRWVRPKNIPLQSNASDCGIFVCLYARWICLKEWDHWSSNCYQFSSERASNILRDHMTRELQQELLLPIIIN